MERICKFCKKTFTVPKERPNQVYCSRECANEAKRINLPICPVCGKKFKRNHGHRVTCSNKCFGIYNDGKTIKEFEKKLDMDMGEYLHQRYVVEEASILEIIIELGMPDNHRRIKRWFKRYGIKPRTPSESVKIQHKRNPERGKYWGKINNNDEVRIKQAISKQKMARLTSIEKAALSLLKGLGLKPIPHYAVKRYNIDLALPDKKIGIEIDGGRWHKAEKRSKIDNKRDKKLIEMGWTIKRFLPEEFDKMLRFVKSLIE